MTLKCPNCGYENDSGTVSCRMCQFAFIKEQLSSSTEQNINSNLNDAQLVVSDSSHRLYENIYKARFLILILVLMVFFLYFVIIG